MSEAAHTSAAHGHGHGHDDGRVHAHISPMWFLCAIFGALIFLTVLTVAVSYVDLGPANTIVAVLIATIKASLVALFFMHLRHEGLFNSVIFVAAFVFLGIFLLLTADDLLTRGKIDDGMGTRTLGRSGAVAPGGLDLADLPRLQAAEAREHAEHAQHGEHGEHGESGAAAHEAEHH